MDVSELSDDGRCCYRGVRERDTSPVQPWRLVSARIANGETTSFFRLDHGHCLYKRLDVFIPHQWGRALALPTTPTHVDTTADQLFKSRKVLLRLMTSDLLRQHEQCALVYQGLETNIAISDSLAPFFRPAARWDWEEEIMQTCVAVLYVDVTHGFFLSVARTISSKKQRKTKASLDSSRSLLRVIGAMQAACIESLVQSGSDSGCRSVFPNRRNNRHRRD